MLRPLCVLHLNVTLASCNECEALLSLLSLTEYDHLNCAELPPPTRRHAVPVLYIFHNIPA